MANEHRIFKGTAHLSYIRINKALSRNPSFILAYWKIGQHMPHNYIYLYCKLLQCVECMNDLIVNVALEALYIHKEGGGNKV